MQMFRIILEFHELILMGKRLWCIWQDGRRFLKKLNPTRTEATCNYSCALASSLNCLRQICDFYERVLACWQVRSLFLGVVTRPGGTDQNRRLAYLGAHNNGVRWAPGDSRCVPRGRLRSCSPGPRLAQLERQFLGRHHPGPTAFCRTGLVLVGRDHGAGEIRAGHPEVM